jgi:Fe-Mn family superoxide dismutase
LNGAIEAHADFQGMTVEELIKGINNVPDKIRMAVRNHGGGHVNHTMFWQIMGPGGGGEPTGPLAGAISGAFGDFPTFKQQFSDAAANRFGSGWAWLVVAGGKLAVESTANQDGSTLTT